MRPIAISPRSSRSRMLGGDTKSPPPGVAPFRRPLLVERPHPLQHRNHRSVPVVASREVEARKEIRLAFPSAPVVGHQQRSGEPPASAAMFTALLPVSRPMVPSRSSRLTAARAPRATPGQDQPVERQVGNRVPQELAANPRCSLDQNGG